MRTSAAAAVSGLCVTSGLAFAQQFPPGLGSDDYTIAEVATNPATCHAYAIRRRITNYQVAWNHSDCAVETAAEHQWLVDTFLSGPGEDQRILWLGGSDRASEGQWVWWRDYIPAIPFTFTAWQAGEPSNEGGCMMHQPPSPAYPIDEDYAAMNWHWVKGLPGAVLGAWADLPEYGRRAENGGDCLNDPHDANYWSVIESDRSYFVDGWSFYNQSVVLGGSAQLEVTLVGTVPLTYRWKTKDGTAIVDGVQASGAVMTGATTNTLSIQNVTAGENTHFFFEVTSPCDVTEIVVPLSVRTQDGCNFIDFNRDGLWPDTADLDSFLCVFAGGVCGCEEPVWCDTIDFNNDGLFPDTLDIDAYLSVFSGGPCLR